MALGLMEVAGTDMWTHMEPAAALLQMRTHAALIRLILCALRRRRRYWSAFSPLSPFPLSGVVARHKESVGLIVPVVVMMGSNSPILSLVGARPSDNGMDANHLVLVLGCNHPMSTMFVSLKSMSLSGLADRAHPPLASIGRLWSVVGSNGRWANAVRLSVTGVGAQCHRSS